MLDQPTWLLLPPFIRDRLCAKTGSDGILSPNLFEPVLKRMRHDPTRARELLKMAGSIQEHLNRGEAGWGTWPQDVAESLYVGLILSTWLEADLPEQLLELPQTDLTKLEEHCRKEGLALEQFLIEQFIQAKET